MIHILPEEFYIGFKDYSGNYVEVFVNPTLKEIREAVAASSRGSVRFIADAVDKNLYVFPSDALHLDAASEINPRLKNAAWDGGDETTLLGTAELDGKYLSITSFSGLEDAGSPYYPEELIEYGIFTDWEWADPWFDNLMAYIEDYRSKYYEWIEEIESDTD